MIVELTSQARKDLGGLDNLIKRRIIVAIEKLTVEPPALRIEQLEGKPVRHKIRVGHYRIVLDLQTPGVAYILRIAHRREVYR